MSEPQLCRASCLPLLQYRLGYFLIYVT